MFKWLRRSLMKKAGKLFNKYLLLFMKSFIETLAIQLADFVVFYIIWLIVNS